MAVVTQYVVQHKGVDKLVTTNKKEADQYDKMLEIADNLTVFIHAKGLALDESVAEELSILLSKNKDSVSKLFKGADVQALLDNENADVIELKKA